MREFKILITDRINGNELDAKTQPSIIHKAGIAGEHNASRLIFCLPDTWSADWTYFVECVNSMGEGLPSAELTAKEVDGVHTVSFDIPQAMTEMGSSDYVLKAVSYDGEEVESIVRSANVRVCIARSARPSKKVLEAIKTVYEELIAKLNALVTRFNNGEFNGATFTPSVSQGGDLSWSNDKGLTNPESVNIKGPKGDKGDKGEDGKDGEDGSFSDELAADIAANTKARHTHPNKELLDSLTESMIGTLDVYHELPETANDGEICIYSPANVPTIADSGKLIYVDWDVFNKTFAQEDFTQFTITFFDSDGTEAGYIYATSWEGSNGGYDTTFEYTKGNEQWQIYFDNGAFNKDNSYYDNNETLTFFDKAPTSFTLPYFSRLESDHYNIGGDVFYAPIRLMVYRDGWYEYTSAAVVDVSIGHGYELPEAAKEGDLFLYAKPNTLTLADSGKRIYFDWEEFRQPVSEEESTTFSLWCSNGNPEAGAARDTNGDYFWIQRINEDEALEFIQVAFVNGVLDSENSSYDISNIDGTETTHFNSIDELPLYFDLPQYESIDNFGLEGNAYLFHTEYKLLKFQGGEWIAATQTDIATDRIESAAASATIQPNTDYVFGECETLTINLAHGNKSKRNEYMFSFISGATPTVLTLPSSVKWMNELTVEANKRYEISIVDNIGLWCAVEVSE